MTETAAEHRGAAYRGGQARNPAEGPVRWTASWQGPGPALRAMWRRLLHGLTGLLTFRRTRERWARAANAARTELRRPTASAARRGGGASQPRQAGGQGRVGLRVGLTTEPRTGPDPDLGCFAYIGPDGAPVTPTRDARGRPVSACCPACGADVDPAPDGTMPAHVPGPTLDVDDDVRAGLFRAWAQDQVDQGTWNPETAWSMFVPAGQQAPDWLRGAWADHTRSLPEQQVDPATLAADRRDADFMLAGGRDGMTLDDAYGLADGYAVEGWTDD